MAEEPYDFEEAPFAYVISDSSSEMLNKAGRVAVAAALVTTLAAGPVDAEAYQLPQPSPIVYVLEPPVPDVPAAPADEATDEDENLWQRLMKMLKWALIVFLLLLACIFGAVKGCTGMIAAPSLPASSASSSAEAAAPAPAAAS